MKDWGKMTDMTDVLRRHRLWLNGDNEGVRANLRGANLEYANLTGAYLTGANLENAYLTGAYLTGANLADAYLAGANLADANLEGADLRGSNLKGANLRGANLKGACLADANLEGANLESAYLADANLESANLAGARLPVGWSRWDVSVAGDTIHIGCQARSRADWDAFFSPESTETLNTKRDSVEWRRIRAAYLAACAWLDAGGLDGLER